MEAAIRLVAKVGAAALLAVAPAAFAGDDGGSHSHARPVARPSIFDAAAASPASRGALPPPRPGTADLDFAELFAPVGRRGLAYSEKARALEGQSVRMLGYMVRQDLPADGMLLLARYPFQLHETEYGLAEDLPASTVHVIVADRAVEEIPHTPGLLLLTGRLELGPREEPDGRVSTVRLVLHPPPALAAGERPRSSRPPAQEKHR